jgi:hypothetical protein
MNEDFESELHRDSVGELSEANVGGSDAAVPKPAEAEHAPGRRRPPIWPFITYFFLVVALISGGGALFQYTAGSAVIEFLMMALSSGMFGLAALVGVIGGLWGRCWLPGYWLAWLLASLGAITVSVAIEYEYMSVQDILERLLIAFVVPAVVFALAAPHLIVRAFCGWRLGRADQPFQPKRSAGLLDLMALVTVLASVSFLLRVPLAVWEVSPGDYLSGIAMAGDKHEYTGAGGLNRK